MHRIYKILLLKELGGVWQALIRFGDISRFDDGGDCPYLRTSSQFSS
jgi:hypothetical protein